MTKRMNKNVALGAAVIGMLSLSGTTVFADVTVDVQAILESGITESVESTLDFGTISIAPGANVVILDASNGTQSSATPETTIDATSTGITTGASGGVIKINSSLEFDYSCSYPATAITMDGAANGGQIFLSEIDTYSTDFLADAQHTGSDPTKANSYIHIGGKLDIPANTPVDTYTGTIDVAITYSAYTTP